MLQCLRRGLSALRLLPVCLATIEGAWATEWAGYIETLRQPSEAETVASANSGFNRLPQAGDAQVWLQREFWATPGELLRRGAGDCEDLAIAKYFALLDLGIAQDRLKLLYGRLYNAGKQRIEPHVVLLYRPGGGGDFVVLDNIHNEIVPLDRRTDLIPELLFDSERIWSRGMNGRWVRISRSRRLHRWQPVVQRWQKSRQQVISPAAPGSADRRLAVTIGSSDTGRL
jgi:predicted transglutaminase-like cysteine proteinase